MPRALEGRHVEAEWMDDPALDAAAHRRALRGLARINALSRSAAQLWPAVQQAARDLNRPVTLLDVACGGGDVTIALARQAQRAELPIEVHGCDVSATALTEARHRAEQSDASVHLHERDVLRDGLPGDYDIVTCTLFLHHLSEAQVMQLLADMANRAGTIVISDLRRTRLGFAAARVATKVLTRSPIVHIDGPRSVRAAFTSAELTNLAESAGLPGARIEHCFPQRMLLTWSARPS